MDEIKEIARKLGSRGGKKTSEKYGSDYYRKLQKKGIQAKLAKKGKSN